MRVYAFYMLACVTCSCVQKAKGPNVLRASHIYTPLFFLTLIFGINLAILLFLHGVSLSYRTNRTSFDTENRSFAEISAEV